MNLRTVRKFICLRLPNCAACIFGLFLTFPTNAHAGMLCEMRNWFKDDISTGIMDTIQIDASKPTYEIDLSNVDPRWRSVCLTSKTEGDYDAISVAELPNFSSKLGKRICDNNWNRIVALLQDDRGAELELAIDSEDLNSKIIHKIYKFRNLNKNTPSVRQSRQRKQNVLRTTEYQPENAYSYLSTLQVRRDE